MLAMPGAGTGDLVEIVSCRKLAKTKAYRVTKLVEKGSSEG